jgi:hypothetical protein
MVYVTYQIKPTALLREMTGKETEYYAIKCRDYDQAVVIASDVNSLDGVTYIRINRCGHLKHKGQITITSGDEYWKKTYGIDYTEN